MDALQHAILFNATQNKHDEEELKALNFEPSEEFIDGVPLCLKIETLQNQLSETLDKQKEKLVELQNSNKPDRTEQIFVIKRNINLICELRSVPIISLQDYEYAEWCYNGGKFRTPDEIIEKQNEIAILNEQKRIAEVRSSKSFNKNYHPILWFLAWFLIPPIVLGIIWEGFQAGIIVGLFIWAFAFIPFAIIAAIAIKEEITLKTIAQIAKDLELSLFFSFIFSHKSLFKIYPFWHLVHPVDEIHS